MSYSKPIPAAHAMNKKITPSGKQTLQRLVSQISSRITETIIVPSPQKVWKAKDRSYKQTPYVDSSHAAIIAQVNNPKYFVILQENIFYCQFTKPKSAYTGPHMLLQNTSVYTVTVGT